MIQFSVLRHVTVGILGALLFAQGLFLAPPCRADEPLLLSPRMLDVFRARAIGPANMGGRVVDVAVVESRPATMYVATASGGLWKTVNRGTTWQPIFDDRETVSIGDVALAPSNPEIVWVGTGESNARNSVSWGDGVYKSSDGGKTWQNMGLKESAHIGRIVVHPRNPDIVYVAALGHLWGPNQERGLFKTDDGGRSWRHVLYENDDTGCIDVALDPNDPDTLYAATYQCRRGPFSGGNPAVQYGPGSGLFKSRDGGRTWLRMARGLPNRPLGRCGLDVYAKDPRIVYAVVQTDLTDSSISGQPARANPDADLGGVFRSENRGETWTKLNDLCPRPFYYGQVRIDPSDDQRVYVLGVHLHISSDGGRTFKDDGAAKVHADHHALWIDPRDPEHLVLGCDGGVNLSHDRGANWEHLNNLPIGQFYALAVDMRKPYRVYGGLQDNGTWSGPSGTRNPEGITNADWHRILGADGFSCQVDPADPNTVYAEAQYGRPRRINVRTGEAKFIRPTPPQGQADYRFNWNAPLLLSPHNARVVYYGGNHLFRSLDRGDHWEAISPDLTRGKPGPSAHTGHTVTTIAESPRKAGVLYVGTDDGRVHVSRDGGAHWADLSDHIPDMPPQRWISRIECSHFDAGTAYLAIDRHRNDDRAPYLFKTADYGTTWVSLAKDLPPGGPVLVMRADSRNKDLLFAGTEFGLFVSVSGGAHWQRLSGGLPTVAIHDLVIHPRDRELVIGTHGRSIYIMDIAPLEEIAPRVLAAEAHLFNVKPAARFLYRGAQGWAGAKTFAAANPPYGSTIAYYLKNTPTKPVQVVISDVLGNTLAVLKETREAGLHLAQWNLRMSVPVGPTRVEARAPPGNYLATLQVDDQVLTKKLRVDTEE